VVLATGKAGVAFIINVTDPAVAHEMLEKLPLGKAHMMSFELIPIGPLNPLLAWHAAETLLGVMRGRLPAAASACCFLKCCLLIKALEKKYRR
jgi:hypothetical protein